MLSYDYTSGQIKRDFVLKKVWGDCDVNPESNTTIGVFCKGCPYYQGWKRFYEAPDDYRLSFKKIGTFVYCQYHKEDDPEARAAIHQIYDNLREEAIKHYYD